MLEDVTKDATLPSARTCAFKVIFVFVLLPSNSGDMFQVNVLFSNRLKAPTSKLYHGVCPGRDAFVKWSEEMVEIDTRLNTSKSYSSGLHHTISHSNYLAKCKELQVTLQ